MVIMKVNISKEIQYIHVYTSNVTNVGSQISLEVAQLFLVR